MATAGVKHQHTQVSAAGVVEPTHAGTLISMLERRTSVPPEAFVLRESLLHRADDATSAALELSDSQWNNVRRARELTRMLVRSERGGTQYILRLPAAPPGANPTVAVRPMVVVDDLTPDDAAKPASKLSPANALSTRPDEVAHLSLHAAGWDEFTAALNWERTSETTSTGLRFVLPSENTLVLNEFRIFRAEERGSAGDERQSAAEIQALAVSTFRSDVGPQIPKQQQDEATRALHYATHFVRELQKDLDVVVQLHRNV